MDPEEFRPFLVQLAGMLAEDAGGLLFVRGRAGSVLLTESDRHWHRVAVEACREGGVTLVGSFLATPAAVRAFPGHLPTATVSAEAG